MDRKMGFQHHVIRAESYGLVVSKAVAKGVFTLLEG